MIEFLLNNFNWFIMLDASLNLKIDLPAKPEEESLKALSKDDLRKLYYYLKDITRKQVVLCVKCGRRLTDPLSRELLMGSECRSKEKEERQVSLF
jgi:hypothetical protein